MVISENEVKQKVADIINSTIGKNILTSVDIKDAKNLSDIPVSWSSKLEEAMNELEELQMRIEDAEEIER